MIELKQDHTLDINDPLMLAFHLQLSKRYQLYLNQEIKDFVIR